MLISVTVVLKNRQKGRSHDIDLERLLRLFYAKNPEFVKIPVAEINIARKRVSQRQENGFLNGFSKKPVF